MSIHTKAVRRSRIVAMIGAATLSAMVCASPASIMPQRNMQADLAAAIETCEPFAELYTHPYTGDALWREIEGQVDERCVYTEGLPGGFQMSCRYMLDRLPRLADFYGNPEKYEGLDVSMKSKLVDGKMVTTTSYSRDGKPFDHPFDGVTETGECTLDRVPDDAASRIPAGTVFGDPNSKAPDGFKRHELPFAIPDSEVARPEDRSAEFWAVVLRTAPSCTILESERSELQTFLQQNRVFVNRFGCDDEFGSDEFMTYNGVDPDEAFIAIYAGTRREHAEWLMSWPLLEARYGETMQPVRMQAVLAYP